jgi:hypothetical protein
MLDRRICRGSRKHARAMTGHSAASVRTANRQLQPPIVIDGQSSINRPSSSVNRQYKDR